MSAPTAPPSPAYLAESIVPTLVVVMWISAGASVLFVTLRCYVRSSMRGAFGLDDAVAVVATALLIAYAAVSTAAASKGLGRHIGYVAQKPSGPEDLVDIGLLCNIGEVLAIMACTLGKTSFAITLYRIVVQPWIHYILWFIIITMNVVNVLAAIFVFAQCENPRHLWNPSVPSKCWPTYVFTEFSLFVGAYSGAQDFVLALLPWVVILRLNMNMKERIAIALAMSLGIFAGATAIVKTTYLVNLSKKTDFTWALPPLLWWAAAEDGLTLVACSIPVLRPLLKKFAKGSSKSSDKKSPGPSYRLSRRGRGEDAFAVRPDLADSHAAVEMGGKRDNLYDDGSDKSILDEHDRDPRKQGQRWADRQSRIVVTREVDMR